ncbi:MAG: O-methyltransferase [Planctomycetes bacterium]|nr:O-methyltransferase [Planctomycetota bacterium]
MPEMTPQRWEHTTTYIRELFCREDSLLAGLMPAATAKGLPAIDAGALTGRLLELLARITSAKLAIEVGTLAGYSGIWIARGLCEHGRLLTVEVSSTHLDLARENFAKAGLADRILQRQGRGIDVLPALLKERGEACADLVFLDAAREEYIPLLPTVHSLLRRGGVLAIDNALHAKRFVPDPYAPGEPPDVMDQTNRALAAHPGFDSILVPLGNGVAIGVRK